MNTPAYLIVHHSGGTDDNPLADSSGYTVKQCDTDHKVRFNMKSSLGWYVGYHYFIDKAGIVTQCRAHTDDGAHTIGYNSKSIGICLAGNFDATMPTKAQIASLRGLLEELVEKYQIVPENIVPHRKFAKKTCYGRLLADDWAKNLLERPKSDIRGFGTLELIQELQRRILEKDL